MASAVSRWHEHVECVITGHGDEHHEVFNHLQACHLSAAAAAQVTSLLDAIRGGQSLLRTAYGAWGFPLREHGRLVSAEKMKDALRQKLLTLLPPLPLVALWEFVPENVQAQLSPYQAVCVPAVDVRKLVRALPFLGTITRNTHTDFKICSEWNVTVRHKKRERPWHELQVDLCNACIEFLAGGVDSVVSPAQTEVSVPGCIDRQSLTPCTLGDLLTGHTDENAEEFEYFKTLVPLPDTVTGEQELRAACKVWKIPRTEKLRSKFRQQIVSLLPSVSLAVVLQCLPEEVQGQFSDLADVLLAAMDVDRVVELLFFLGSWKQQSEPDVLRVCATWGVAVREGNCLRPQQRLAAELRGACIRFLKEDTATSVALEGTDPGISAGIVSGTVRTALASDSLSMVAQAPAENLPDGAASLQPEDVRALTTALAMVREKCVAPRTRATGKKQAVPAIPADLSQAIESLREQGILTWAERKPWMIRGGCKEKRKHDGKFVYVPPIA